MNAKSKISASIIAVILCAAASADESLSTCSAEKTHQMELMRNIKLAPSPPANPYNHRTYSSFDKHKAQDDVNRIDEWLWKNCRQFSEELRTIEQQYM